MATIAASSNATAPAVSLGARLRTFLWLSSGMFSPAALGLSFVGYYTFGPVESASTYFAAAVISALLFGMACILKLGPESA